jgi:hypothetical protein
MLFDLRGAGRRKTVQVTYILLAVLMGGGLILFGIGGSVSGGLVDAITGSSGTSSGNAAYEKRVKQTLAETRARPRDPAAWADLARARFQLASTSDNLDQATGTWTASGKKALTSAAAAWQRHLKLAGSKPDDGVAGLMVQAYSAAGLNQPQNAVAAQQVITQARPTSATFANLAVLAYGAGNTRLGDLASKKALSLSDKDLRANLKSQLDQAKQQSAAAAAASATPAATPSATATATPKASTKGSKKGSKKSSGK